MKNEEEKSLNKKNWFYINYFYKYYSIIYIINQFVILNNSTSKNSVAFFGISGGSPLIT